MAFRVRNFSGPLRNGPCRAPIPFPARLFVPEILLARKLGNFPAILAAQGDLGARIERRENW